ncbi:carbohydrate kinase [Dictyocaulus viviparus]|uniref:ATP-dependent NAD(P)H-hydrate dehydratase n=1 Tax=Dictyocaulus viviparus TaxID=29172 RepID=A0A0D8Y078_DICVI|nr:carbohydrate kinase [Dictyocaulus viviparus]
MYNSKSIFSMTVDYFVRDGLWFLCNSLQNAVPALQSAILTPNIVEFSRLCESALGVHGVLTIQDRNQLQKLACRLSSHLGTSLFLKGQVDIITTPDGNVIIGDEDGCPRRCGGQGDITSGTIAVFLLWASRVISGNEGKLAAGLASSQLVRRCAKLAFSSKGRSMIATDIINNIPSVLIKIDEKA